jgi:RHS repeat-associated protein
MKHTAYYLSLILAAAILPLSLLAQTAVGLPAFNSFGGGPFDTINLGNLNAHFVIPIRHKAGRGTPFAYDLTYDSSIWAPITAGGVKTWQPVGGYWGWEGLTGSSPNNLTYNTTYSSGACGQFGQYTWQQWQFNGFVFTDYHGSHTFSYTAYWVQSNGPSGQCPPTGAQPATAPPVQPTDRSGVTLYAVATGPNTISWNVTTPTGFVPVNGYAGIDANGNEITASNGVFTDTLGQIALTVAGGAPPSSTTLTYVAPSGQNATYTASYKPYTVKTNFGCTGIGEYNVSNTYLVDKITLPDTSFYQFTYEPTAGGSSGQVTGRLVSVTLPTGGSISYSYPLTNNGNNNGINCTDGSAPTGSSSAPSLTRVVNPGGTWKYVRTQVSGKHWQTTITDPTSSANQTQIDFQQDGSFTPNFFPTQQINYQGSSTALATVITCYNTVNPIAANCPTTAVSTPITRITSFFYLPSVSGSSEVSETDTQYSYISVPGYESEVDSYDYGTGVVGPLIRKAVTVYNAFGSNVQPTSVQIQDVSSNVKSSTTYSYDQTTPTATSGTPQHVSVTGGRGNLTTLTKQVSSTASLIQTFSYYDTGNLNVATDVNGTQTTYAYGSSSCGNSFPTQNSAAGLSYGYTWNCTGGVATLMTDANGNNSSTNYTDADFWRPSRTVDQLNNQTNISYIGQTAVEASLGFNNGQSVSDVRTTRDGFGRSILSQTLQAPGSSNYDTKEVDYNNVGQPSRSTMLFSAPAGGTSSSAPGVRTTYDALSRPLLMSDSTGANVAYTYTNNDVLLIESSSQVFKRQLEYDALGRLSSVCEISTTLPGHGTCAQSVSQTGYWTKYTYDPLGNLLTVTQNAQGGTSQTRTFTYDWLGRMTSESNPETGLVTYTYDSACTSTPASPGDLTTRVDNAGNTTCYYYDGLHRMNGAGLSTLCRRWSYDANSGTTLNAMGKLFKVTTDNCANYTPITQELFSYDKDGRPTDLYESTPHSSGTYHTTASYWPNGALNTLDGVPGVPKMTYGVDGEGRSTTVTAASGQNPVTGVNYVTANGTGQPVGALTQVTFGSADSDSYQFDPNSGRMTQYNFNVNGQSAVGNLTWNSNGTLQKLAITDPFNSQDNQTCTYTYDDLARSAGVSCGSLWAQTYTFDAFGNITKSGSISWNPGYNLANNRYNQAGTSYDANGNLLNDSFNTYTWDPNWGSLASANGAAITYDGLGRMVEDLNGQYQFVYSPLGGQPLAYIVGQSHPGAYVPLPGGAFAMYNSSGLFQYNHPDWLGSARLFSTPTRSAIAAMAYAPFGEGYAGGQQWIQFTNSGDTWTVFDNENQTGSLEDFTYRRYSPVQGRWISPDPAGVAAVDPTNPQSWNRYAYVMNTPLSLIDPMGLSTLGNCPTDPPPPNCFYVCNGQNINLGMVCLGGSPPPTGGPGNSGSQSSPGAPGGPPKKGGCTQLTGAGQAVVAALGVAAKLTNRTIGFGVGGSTGAGITIAGFNASLSAQIVASPDGTSGLAVSFITPSLQGMVGVASGGFGGVAGAQISASTVGTVRDLEGPGINAGAFLADEIGVGFDTTFAEANGELTQQINLTLGFGGGGGGHSAARTETVVIPFCPK